MMSNAAQSFLTIYDALSPWANLTRLSGTSQDSWSASQFGRILTGSHWKVLET